MCLDSSAAMVAAARGLLADPRIAWLHMAAEQLEQLEPGSIDICVYNMAMWGLNVEIVLAGLRRVMRPGGRLAFNIGYWIADASQATATARPVGLEERWRNRLAQAGYQVAATNWTDYEQSWEAVEAWAAVPVFGRLA